jgi:hypothetical protein
MKLIKHLLILPLALLFLAGCKKDNYDAPNASIHGALTDAEIGGVLELSGAGTTNSFGAGTYSNVRMLVNDPAKYPSPSPFDLVTRGDGTYSNSQIFAENYRIFPLAASGPWQYLGDSTKVSIGAGQDVEVNFKVTPFFRITAPVVADSALTFTVTKAAATPATNNLTTTNNLIILINNYNIVNESVSSNKAGAYYQNQFQFTVTNSILGVPYTPTAGTDVSSGKPYSFKFGLAHLPKGTYFFRIGVLGSGSNGKYNYSPVVQATIH